ncbi:hypothetical protein ACQ27_gp080 [Klebsiella phage K64-1]|nr:hypothetical protein ACQ27_gp080 [Klebsiella phage K64-1]
MVYQIKYYLEHQNCIFYQYMPDVRLYH